MHRAFVLCLPPLCTPLPPTPLHASASHPAAPLCLPPPHPAAGLPLLQRVAHQPLHALRGCASHQGAVRRSRSRGGGRLHLCHTHQPAGHCPGRRPGHPLCHKVPGGAQRCAGRGHCRWVAGSQTECFDIWCCCGCLPATADGGWLSGWLERRNQTKAVFGPWRLGTAAVVPIHTACSRPCCAPLPRSCRHL